jgi:hypothetical protein
MPCDSRLLPNQTIQQRAEEIRASVPTISELLASGRVKVKVGPQGAIAFEGLTEVERRRMTDACIYRRVINSGTLAAKLAIQKAETLAGRKVDSRVVAQGVHSHDGGATWHGHKG